MGKQRAEKVRLPVHRLKKAEFVWLGSHKCRHGHNYLEHYNCFLQENPNMEEKVGFMDIETSNLDANFGIILTYCIKDSQSPKIYFGHITPEDIKKYPADKIDKRVVKDLTRDIQLFDRIVTHYGRRFDIPFIRTRALVVGIEFPYFGSISNDDTWLIARRKLKLNSNRQDTVDRTLFGNTNKTRVCSKYWIAALQGNKRALNYILDHNKRDVIALERVWNKLKDFVSKTNCSI